MKKFTRTLLAATTFAIAMSSVSFAGEWRQEANGKYKYRLDTGYDAAGRVYEIGPSVYGFDAEGNMLTDWQNMNGTWYYFNPTPGGSQGEALKGWQYIGNAWYYLTPAMSTGFMQIGSGLFYLDPASGAMKTGWFDDGVTDYMYYANADGYVQKNTTFVIGDVTYKADSDGRIKYMSPTTKLTDIPWRDLVKTADGKREESNQSIQEDVAEKVEDWKTAYVESYYKSVYPYRSKKTYSKHLDSWKKKVTEKLTVMGIPQADINTFIYAVQGGRYYNGYYTEEIAMDDLYEDDDDFYDYEDDYEW